MPTPDPTLVVANLGSNDIAWDVAPNGATLRNFVAPATPQLVNHGTQVLERAALSDSLGLAPRAGCRATIDALAARMAAVAEDELRRRLRFPILQPALRWLIDRGVPVTGVDVVVTDQTPQHFDDTVHMAPLTERWLAELAGLPGDADLVRGIPYQGRPIDYNDAIAFYDAAIPQPGDEFGQLVVVLTGGVPAMNSALQEVALAKYGCAATLLVVTPPANRGAARDTGEMGKAVEVLTWPLRKREMVRVCAPLLGRHECSAAKAIVIASTKKDERGRAELRDLTDFLDYASYRFSDDYSRAADALRGPAVTTADRHALQSYWNALRLDDMLATAEICWARDDVYGFLARLASLRDLARRHLLRRLTGFEVQGPGLPAKHYEDNAWVRAALGALRTPSRRTRCVRLDARDYGWLISAVARPRQPDWEPAAARAQEAFDRTHAVDRLRHEAIHEQLKTPQHRQLRKCGNANSATNLLTRCAELVDAVTPLADPAPTTLDPLDQLGGQALIRMRDLPA